MFQVLSKKKFDNFSKKLNVIVIKKLPTNRSEFFTGEFYQTLRASTYPETLAKNYRGRSTPTFIL